jgi:23S rRNA pseudouridine955/2504/2580 synthase
MNPDVQFYDVDEPYAGQRLDNFLLARLKGVPKSLIYRVIRKGEVRVNKGRSQADYKLQTGDRIRIPPIRRPDITPHQAPDGLQAQLLQAVLFDDLGLIIFNKPAGLAVHGGSGVSLGLIEAARQAFAAPHLELIHRLDRDTSGCVMVARKRSLLKTLQEALRHKEHIRKRYLAVVHGQFPEGSTCVEVPLERQEYPNGERIVRVSAQGKSALTRFKRLAQYPDCALVEAEPVTGRTHQIRVHALHLGHPLLGDEKYASNEQCKQAKALGFKRLALHAAELTLPIGETPPLRVSAPLPADMAQPLAALDRSFPHARHI